MALSEVEELEILTTITELNKRLICRNVDLLKLCFEALQEQKKANDKLKGEIRGRIHRDVLCEECRKKHFRS